MESADCETLSNYSCLTLTDLPNEIIEHILCCKAISHADLLRISEVCTKLRDITNSRRLWHAKFCQSWRSLCELYDNHQVDWKENYQQRYMYGKTVHKWIREMRQAPSYSMDCSFSEFRDIAEENRLASHFMLDEMESILYDENCYARLTAKYYCSKLLHFARQKHLKTTIREFLQQYENNQQPLDIGAALISQFCQPLQRVNFKDISEKLDDIALLVKTAVDQSCPKLSVLLKDLVPSTTILTESLWPPSECRLILACLNSVLFNDLEFECIHEDQGFSADQILIDKVLEGKTGVPVVIAIIYASVAHRLGVFCKLCEPTNSVLKWLEHPDLDKIKKYTYIDVTKSGKSFAPAELLTSVQLGEQEQKPFCAKSVLQVFKDMTRNLTHIGGRDLHHLEERLLYESSIVELGLLLSPSDKEKILMLVQLYLQMDARLFEVSDLLHRIPDVNQCYNHRLARIHAELEHRTRPRPLARERREKRPKPKLRTNCPSVSFAVGMIMKHKKYDYVCVIYGWDKLCRASNHWIQQMRVYELKEQNYQPFYNVLVEDGTQRYAAQENLEICQSPRFIEHPDVGKYFEEFQNCCFVPNEWTRAEYPQDNREREVLLREFFASHETPFGV